jgi:biopolymer transport protein ExbD
MPVKLNSKLPVEDAEARIEIIPLIDIMFFLLAAFMLVSLSMVTLKSVKVNLPSAANAATDVKKDVADISVDRNGGTFLEGKPVAANEMARMLGGMARANRNLKVIISGDRQAMHGDIIHVLDVVRSAGIDRVAFEIGQDQAGQKAGSR